MSEKHYDTVREPYISGLDGHICTSVKNLAGCMISENADFMGQVYLLISKYRVHTQLNWQIIRNTNAKFKTA
jgi:hypothetical protein